MQPPRPGGVPIAAIRPAVRIADGTQASAGDLILYCCMPSAVSSIFMASSMFAGTIMVLMAGPGE